jgi:hypothetical protein
MKFGKELIDLFVFSNNSIQEYNQFKNNYLCTMQRITGKTHEMKLTVENKISS